MGGDPQALDRYAYVRNNPLKYVDPTGLTGVYVGGWDMHNEKGEINKRGHNFREWVKEYWTETFGPGYNTDFAWYCLELDLREGKSVEYIIDKYDVAFFDTAGKGYLGFGSDYPVNVNAAVSGLSGLIDEHNIDVTLMVGYCFGGVVVHDYIWKITRGMEGPTGFDVILIQPALRIRTPNGDIGFHLDPWRDNDPRSVSFSLGPVHLGMGVPAAGHPELHASEWSGRIVCVNQASSPLYGVVWGSKEFRGDSCTPGHCSMNAKAEEVMSWLYP